MKAVTQGRSWPALDAWSILYRVVAPWRFLQYMCVCGSPPDSCHVHKPFAKSKSL